MSATYRLGLYEKSMPMSLTLPDKLCVTSEAGFNFMELSIDESDEKLLRLNWVPTERRELREASADAGTTVGSICLSAHRKYPIGSVDASVRACGLDIMARAIDLAADLGVRLIQLAGYDVYYELSSDKTRALFAENLRRSVEWAASAGVTLAFETMETPFMDTVEKAMHFVRLINSPYLQVYPDLGNLTNAALLYGHDVASDLESGRGYIAALHLKEARPGIYREIPFGAGYVNFVSGIGTAWAQGVRRFVCEFWAVEDWRAQIDRAHAFIRAQFEKSGVTG
ncbi:MAG: L-ribulose-5-phosphate 3-epimerase [Firmicutes bacterium]|nr:L-ribulose-5-phosphate 3-epimerase [Bacillota bacterium]